jgi:hypothetical protein
MNALQFLLDYSNASEYEDKRDETTNTWLFFANAMEEYHKHKVNNGVLDGVIVCEHKQHWRTLQEDGSVKKVCCNCNKGISEL